MNTRQGSTLGGILLVAGSCIGAGMLGLPVLTGNIGFFPSLLVFVVIASFMTCTGLLLAEVNIRYGKPSGLISLAGATLGRAGKGMTWFLFLFLFYSLTVAYILGSGALFVDIIYLLFQVELVPITGSLFFTFLFGAFVFFGARSVDLLNRLLMVGLILSYVVLISVCFPEVQKNLILDHKWLGAYSVLPVLIVSFGFHNIVPTLYRYLGGRRSSLYKSIIFGCLVPLVIYLFWEFIALGILPKEGANSLRSAFESGITATQAIKEHSGSPTLKITSQCFAFFALTTSFLAQSLSFVDFLSDGTGIPKKGFKKLFLCSLVFLPPFLLGLVYPQIFYSCLEYAGAFGATILFGIMPVLMVRKLRKNDNRQNLLPGGNGVLFSLLAFSVLLILLGVARQLSWIEIY
jgi:tyrosine-specific transport protein